MIFFIFDFYSVINRDDVLFNFFCIETNNQNIFFSEQKLN